jgi:O-antigen/teichoic acid export membrane protein
MVPVGAAGPPLASAQSGSDDIEPPDDIGPVIAPAVERVVAGAPPSETSRHIRGSSLLLVGRTLSMAINFAAQVLIVRYLTREDYGAFAYALSIVTFGQTLITFGLDRGFSRFMAIYDERGEDDRVLGTMVMVGGTITILGVLLVLVVLGSRDWLASALSADAGVASILAILILLAPIQALDELLTSMLAVFASPRSIFLRKYVLAPALRLAVVALLIVGAAGLDFLAAGYVVAAFVGVDLYLVVLVRVLHSRGILERLRRAAPRIRIPAREILLFTIPLLTTDLVYIALNTSDAILLEHFRGLQDVAAWRVVQPAAGLNQLVLTSFTLLYTPVAARLFAREDRSGVRDLYWQTAIWMAIVSFPLFAVTFSLAESMTVALYGERYAESATYMALLSFGYFFNTALGFNGLTLRIFGVVRYVVVINVLAIVTNVALNVVLISRLGALGAAIGTTATLVIHNLLKQAGLRLGTGISIFEPRYLRVYVIIVAVSIALWLVGSAVRPPLIVGLGLAALASLLVFLPNRAMLRVDETFPELRRLPLSRWLLGG